MIHPVTGARPAMQAPACGRNVAAIHPMLGPLNAICYLCTMITSQSDGSRIKVQRVQTGVRIEKRLLKVLKAMAEYRDISLGDLIEGICLHAFDGQLPFDEATRKKIAKLKEIYGLDLDACASHRLQDQAGNEAE